MYHYYFIYSTFLCSVSLDFDFIVMRVMDRNTRQSNALPRIKILRNAHSVMGLFNDNNSGFFQRETIFIPCIFSDDSGQVTSYFVYMCMLII